ncbi:hypothetical protein D9758_016344 [Tetrapyrgos nigripes]|uniref:Uncharacterized protein n=1 Tax=Tetrapyrgos nigripes TaxID=182062 RepID=A0A8H5BZX3_9AGAR|nr:hypothetical protein D9758_016344 [Tetrapyrgos nigripes]
MDTLHTQEEASFPIPEAMYSSRFSDQVFDSLASSLFDCSQSQTQNGQRTTLISVDGMEALTGGQQGNVDAARSLSSVATGHVFHISTLKFGSFNAPLSYLHISSVSVLPTGLHLVTRSPFRSLMTFDNSCEGEIYGRLKDFRTSGSNFLAFGRTLPTQIKGQRTTPPPVPVYPNGLRQTGRLDPETYPPSIHAQAGFWALEYYLAVQSNGHRGSLVTKREYSCVQYQAPVKMTLADPNEPSRPRTSRSRINVSLSPSHLQTPFYTLRSVCGIPEHTQQTDNDLRNSSMHLSSCYSPKLTAPVNKSTHDVYQSPALPRALLCPIELLEYISGIDFSLLVSRLNIQHLSVFTLSRVFPGIHGSI